MPHPTHPPSRTVISTLLLLSILASSFLMSPAAPPKPPLHATDAPTPLSPLLDRSARDLRYHILDGSGTPAAVWIYVDYLGIGARPEASGGCGRRNETGTQDAASFITFRAPRSRHAEKGEPDPPAV